MDLLMRCQGSAVLSRLACTGNRTYSASVTGRLWREVRVVALNVRVLSWHCHYTLPAPTASPLRCARAAF